MASPFPTYAEASPVAGSRRLTQLIILPPVFSAPTTTVSSCHSGIHSAATAVNGAHGHEYVDLDSANATECSYFSPHLNLLIIAFKY